MTAAPTPIEAPAWARPFFERQIAVVGELAEAGLEMALLVRDRTQAVADDDAAPIQPGMLEGLMRAYDRAARAVRLSVMLQEKLVKDLIAFDNRAGQEAAWDARERTRERKGQVERILDRVITDAPEACDTERLTREARERLDTEDFYGPIFDRPLPELVAMICRDLGLTPDWAALAQEAWAQEAWAQAEDLGDAAPPTSRADPFQTPNDLILHPITHERSFSPRGQWQAKPDG